MEIQAKQKLKQLQTGVHLVTVTDAVLAKENGVPKESDDGKIWLTVRFSTGGNKHFDKDYWYNEDWETAFKCMCASANIDPASEKFKREASGKRLWICIKEVHDIDGDKPVIDDITGPSINYELFDTLPCLDPNKKPIVKGDPADNNGIASGAFLDYKQIGKETFIITDGVKNRNPTGKEISEADSAYTQETKTIEQVLKDHGHDISKTSKQAFQDLLIKGKAVVEPIKPKEGHASDWEDDF